MDISKRQANAKKWKDNLDAAINAKPVKILQMNAFFVSIPTELILLHVAVLMVFIMME